MPLEYSSAPHTANLSPGKILPRRTCSASRSSTAHSTLYQPSDTSNRMDSDAAAPALPLPLLDVETTCATTSTMYRAGDSSFSRTRLRALREPCVYSRS